LCQEVSGGFLTAADRHAGIRGFGENKAQK